MNERDAESGDAVRAVHIVAFSKSYTLHKAIDDAHILLDVVMPGRYGAFSKLHSHLSRRIVCPAGYAAWLSPALLLWWWWCLRVPVRVVGRHPSIRIGRRRRRICVAHPVGRHGRAGEALVLARREVGAQSSRLWR
jgi:hypothetical protein